MTKTAAELCAYHEIRLLPEGRALLSPELTPRQYFDRLRANGHYADARRVLAHALSRRRALWWGCLCAADAYEPHPEHPDWQALDIVARYVVAGNEPERRLIETISKDMAVETPGGCLLMAAFFSGGSTSTVDRPFVPPKSFVTCRLVGASVYLASVWNDPPHYVDHLRNYLDLGLALAQEAEPWEPPTPQVASQPLRQWLQEAKAHLCSTAGKSDIVEGADTSSAMQSAAF